MKTDMYEYTCTYIYICLEWIWIYTKDQQRNIWCNTIIMLQCECEILCDLVRWCSCCCTSFRALLSGDLLFWRSFITFLAPSWTADSILKWCRNSSILSSRGDSTSHRWLAANRGNRFNLLGHRILKSWNCAVRFVYWCWGYSGYGIRTQSHLMSKTN